MKKKSIISLLLFIVKLAFGQSYTKLKELSLTHQFIAMDSLNNLTKGGDYYLYKALFANVCNNPQLSNQYLDSLNNVATKNSFDYWRLKNDNHIKTFNYKMAFETSKQLTKRFSKNFTTEELKDELNTQNIWRLLKHQACQKINEFSNVTVTTKKDKAGLTTIIVEGNKNETSFVFDTGAGLNCINESTAKKHSVKLVSKEKVFIKSFTGQMCKVNIGLAPTLKIGDIIIENAIFLIYPDSAFSFANGTYVINGIIGFPIAKELGTITMASNTLVFSKLKNQNFEEKNLFVDHLRAIVTLRYKNKKIPFNLDSGAKTSLFTKSFYETFKDYIDLNGVLSTREEAGAGSKEVKKEIVELINQEVFLNSNPISIKRMSIDKIDYGIYGKRNYGNIGQDVISQFKKVIISFDNNYLRLEN